MPWTPADAEDVGTPSGLSRRALLGAAAGAAGVTAGAAVFGETADAAQPGIQVGLVSIPRLWGRDRRIWAPATDTFGAIRRADDRGGLVLVPGSVPLGTPGVSVLWGSRTHAGGPLRALDRIRLTDDVVITIDGASTRYRAVAIEVVPTGTDYYCRDLTAVTSWDTGGRHGISLVTSSRANHRPGSNKYRLLVRLLPVPVPPPPTVVAHIEIPRFWGPTQKLLLAATDNLRRDTNRGQLVLLPGSVALGTAGVSVVYGHRTSSGGVLRYIHRLRPTDDVVVITDTISTTYRAAGVEIVPTLVDLYCQDNPAVTAWDTEGHHGISLISDTKPDGRPTSTKYRMLIRLLPV